MAKVLMLLTNPFRPDPRVHKEAKALVAAGHAVTILAWDREKGPSAQENVDGIAVSRFGPKSAFSNIILFVATLPLFWLGCIWTMLRTEWDAVQCNDLDTLPAGLLAARIRGKPVVYDSHEIYSAMVEKQLPRPIFRLVEGFERWMVKRPDAVICVNDRFASILKGWGAREPVPVMGCQPLEPVDGARIDALRREHGLDGKRVVLYVGVLEPTRKLVELVEGFEARRWPDAALVVGGFGTLEGRIAAAAKGSAVFVGAVSPADVPAYTHLADVLVAVYDPRDRNNRDSVPNKLFEAMSGGKPIIVAKGTWTGETAEKVGCGIAVDYDGDAVFEAMRRLLDDRTLYDRTSEAGRRAFAAEYNWDAMSKRFLSVYDSLLA
jgi:glycosyltransferase involved in cell wall biosynthesis